MNQEADRRQDLGLSLLPFEPQPERHRCDNGWLPDLDGCAVPCRRCKPHLSREQLPNGQVSWRTARRANLTAMPVSSQRKVQK
jgi:hypothetical protein